MRDRTTCRRGLYDIDGNALSETVIRAAHNGSVVDRDICHASIRGMVANMCWSDIVTMVRELDLESNVWFTHPYDECGRYADDIVCDWSVYGVATYGSLHDTVSAYMAAIEGCPKPKRTAGNVDFEFTIKHGTIPKGLANPRHPAEYRISEGHTSRPDGVCHPLLEHMESCVPPGLIPHRRSGCGYTEFPVCLESSRTSPTHNLEQPEKEGSIKEMILSLHPEAAYVAEMYGRHDILLYGNVDTATAFGLADQIQYLHGTPVGCMVLGSDALLVDPEGNDAKRIISHGAALTGSLRTTGMAGIVRPAALTSGTIAANLDRHGL